jgi:hypothetical protein
VAYDEGKDTGLVRLRLDAAGQPLRDPDWKIPPAALYMANWYTLDSSFRAAIGIELIADSIAAHTKRVGANKVVSDQYEAFSFEGLLRRRGGSS